MKMRKKSISIYSKKLLCCIAFAVFSITLFSGCWDRMETDELAMIGSIALDKFSEDKVLVSMEIVNPAALARGLGQETGMEGVVGWVIREEASTVPNAILNAQRRVPLNIFIGQANTIILGQNFAREGEIAAHLEYFSRRAEVRRSIFLATCDSANNLLQRPFMEELPSLTLEGLAEKSMTSGKSVAVTLNEFLMKLSEPGIEPITMHVAGRETKDIKIRQQGDILHQEHPADPPRMPLESEINIPGLLPPDHKALDPLRESGTGEAIENLTVNLGIAVFKGDRLVGFLDGNHARGYLWVVGRMPRGGFLEIENPFDDSGILGIKVVRVNSSMKPVIQGDELSMSVEVAVDLELLALPIGIRSARKEEITKIEQAVNSFIEREIRATLRIVQREFQSDIYGFGQMLYHRNPHLWQELSKEWNDDIFPDLDIAVNVQSRARSSSTIIKRK